jgi:hypothetical protein
MGNPCLQRDCVCRLAELYLILSVLGARYVL